MKSFDNTETKEESNIVLLFHPQQCMPDYEYQIFPMMGGGRYYIQYYNKEARDITDDLRGTNIKAFGNRFIPNQQSLDNIRAIVLTPSEEWEAGKTSDLIPALTGNTRQYIVKGFFCKQEEMNEKLREGFKAIVKEFGDFKTIKALDKTKQEDREALSRQAYKNRLIADFSVKTKSNKDHVSKPCCNIL